MPARRVAFEVLRRTFEHEAWADRAFRSAAERLGLEGRERALAQRLAYGAVQRRGTSDHIAAELARRPVADLDPPLRAALRLGLYELLFSDGAAAHAVVGEAVELAKGGMRAAGAGGAAGAAAGVVNAVLRRADRERDRLLGRLDDSTPEGAAVAHSFPPWLARMWWDELGAADARAVMAAMNEPAERALRVNTLRAEPAAVVAELRERGEEVEGAAARPATAPLLAPDEAIVVAGRWGDALREAVAAGKIVPQSRASQGVVALLGLAPGHRVLDVCAGPGIKSTAIAAKLEDRGAVRSIEIAPGRAAEITQLCRRQGIASVRVETADASRADLGEGYDRILVDPPCTDLGTLAARPDARWRKEPGDPPRLAELQGELLGRAALALGPGGVLVYSTCTVSRREGEDVVGAVVGREEGLVAEDLGRDHAPIASPHDPRFLQTRPDRDGTDGFFMARLRRDG
jgi:16S rRNA (cytosine967-C5)-methyltransferase